MGRIARGVVVATILTLLLGNLTTNVVARSVHSTSDIDIFPQGAIAVSYTHLTLPTILPV